MRKEIAIILSITGIIIAIYLIGTYVLNQDYNRKSRTTITYTEDDYGSRMTASYPPEKSASILSYLRNWSQTNSVTRKTGDTVVVSFKDGRSCKVYAKGGKLAIIAAQSHNDRTSISKFKADFQRINKYILSQVKTKPSRP